jgi:hypothetical protein
MRIIAFVEVEVAAIRVAGDVGWTEAATRSRRSATSPVGLPLPVPRIRSGWQRPGSSPPGPRFPTRSR